jgi:hypothetical protein
LWEAPTAAQWETQMYKTKRSNRSKYWSVQTSVESLASIRDQETKRDFLQRFPISDPLALNILIHGIISAIGDDKYRTSFTASSSATRMLKIGDFGVALKHWKECFDCLPESDRDGRISWNSILMYHFAAILLRNNISDIQLAAGSAYAFGRKATSQRAQEAYIRLVSPEPVSHETYLHGLDIVRLCLRRPDSNTLTTSVAFDSSLPPLWQTHCAFLGTLVIWAYTLGLEQAGVESIKSTTFTDPETQYDEPAGRTLIRMFERISGRSNPDLRELQAIRSDLRVLIGIIHDRLEGSSWEICEFD